MKFTKLQIQSAYKKLPTNIQDFVMSAETSETTENLINKTNSINAENKDFADSEILWAMLGLQSLSQAIESIAKKNSKGPNEFFEFRKQLEEKIFNRINTLGNIEKFPGQIDQFSGLIKPENELEDNKSEEKPVVKENLASVPNYAHYEPGQDPYHEPIE